MTQNLAGPDGNTLAQGDQFVVENKTCPWKGAPLMQLNKLTGGPEIAGYVSGPCTSNCALYVTAADPRASGCVFKSAFMLKVVQLTPKPPASTDKLTDAGNG